VSVLVPVPLQRILEVYLVFVWPEAVVLLEIGILRAELWIPQLLVLVKENSRLEAEEELLFFLMLVNSWKVFRINVWTNVIVVDADALLPWSIL